RRQGRQLAPRARRHPWRVRDAVRGRQGQVSGDRSAVPTGTRTWLDPDWRAGALAWAEAVLADRGRTLTGSPEHPHVRPWSTAIRLPTDGGAAWFKASGPGSAHEGPLLEVFRTSGVRHVLLPMAVHPEHPWL